MTRKLLWLSLTAIVLFAVGMTAAEIGTRKPKAFPPIEVGAAEALLDRTAQMARDGNHDAICDEVADHPSMCRSLLEGARESDWWPDADRPATIRVTGAGTTRVILHLEGHRHDGTAYDADFEVTWGLNKERLVSNYPIYWSGVSMI